MTDIYNPGREAIAITASPNIQTERARFDPNADVNSLLSALGTQSTQQALAEFNAQHEARKLEEQKGKFDYYVEQFSQDHQGGAVSQAQVKARFPETVPVISARIAEAIGQKEGRKQFQTVIDEIAGNDNLRLDTNARAAFVAQKRTEMVKQVGQGNDFFGAGLASSMDRLMAQHETNWQTETAAYHQKVQGEQFSADVVDAFNGGNPKALLEVDAKWKQSSSLNDLERNKIVVNSAIDLAAASDDPSVLQKVPQRFLNIDTKAALEKARIQLTDRRMTDFKNVYSLKEIRRAEDLRASRIAIVKTVATGQTVDPMAYRHDPEAFQFAMQMREAKRVDESQSVAAAQAIRSSVIDTSTMGTSMTLGELQNVVLSRPDLNPGEKQKLIDEAPKLLEGRNLMADDMVRQPITDRLNPRLTAVENSANGTLQAMLAGRNIRSEVMREYDGQIRRSFQAEYEETGNWPKGHRKLELIDKAVERAEKALGKVCITQCRSE